MRIVAGERKGIRLDAPAGQGTRPTSDRLRESLFSMLGAGQRTGVLEIMRGPAGDRGRILLRQGRIASARIEGLRRSSGLDAVEALGKWKDGAFTFVEEAILVGEDAAASVPRL